MTTYGGPNASSAAAASSAVVHTRASAVGTPAAAITSLAKALEPSSRAAAARRAEAGDARGADGVGDPGDQRRLGTDHDQVGADPRGQVGDRRAVHRVDGVQGGDGGDARVARGGVHLGDVGVAGERERQRVLAAAAPDDQDPAGPRLLDATTAQTAASVRTMVCSRPGPTPTPQNGAPDISSSART